MADLSNLETTSPTVATYPGIVVTSAGQLVVNVNGNILPARWADPMVVSPGDPVLVEISSGATGQGQAFVRCRLAPTARPGSGKVKTSTPGTIITVTGSDGVDYSCTFLASYSPVAGDNVALDWRAAQPNVLGKIGVIAATSPGGGVAPPPGQVMVGTSTYPASDSATWHPSFGWDNWAGGAGNLFQGSYGGSPQLAGAWFYAGSPSELAGRTITRIQIRAGARRTVGSYNSPAYLHFYAHTSPSRPSGDAPRVAGPFDYWIPPGWPGGTLDLPLEFAAALQNGGGISVFGDPYTGLNGRNSQPDSGTLTIDWRR